MSSDLQTMRNYVARRFGGVPPNLEGERLYLEMLDGSGDRLAATLNRNAAAAPLVVLIHGITGCETSSHMTITPRYLHGLGYSVLHLNLRGAGPSREACRGHYHGGSSNDISDALSAIEPGLTRAGLLLAGYSLGGSVLLKFLSEYGKIFPVRAAAAVSAPIDLLQASLRILRPRNRFYERWLLARMKEEISGAKLTDSVRKAIESVRSVYAFDDEVVAPLHGFDSAEHYYEECSSVRGLPKIPVPTLALYASDDPWIPADAYLDFPWRVNPNLTMVLSAVGAIWVFTAEAVLFPGTSNV